MRSSSSTAKNHQRTTPPSSETQSVFLLNLIASVLALSFAAVYAKAFADAGTVISPADVAKSLALSFLILFAPTAAQRGTPKSSGGRVFLESAGTVITFLGLCLLGLLSRYGLLPDWTTAMLLIAAVLVVAIALLRSAPEFLSWRVPAVILLSVPFGAWLVAVAWYTGHQSPDFFERIVLGTAHVDTLFHAAIANSINVLGYPSTAVDGAPYHYYHWGSHWIFARLAQLLDVPVLTFYNVSFQIVMLPLFFKALGLFSLTVRAARSLEMRIGIGFLILLMVMTVTFWDETTSRLVGVWTGHAVGSESYSTSLTFGFLFTSIVVFWWRRFASPTSRLVLAWLGIPVMIAVAGLLKISVMVLAAGGYVYWLIRSRQMRVWQRLVSTFIVAVVAVVMVLVTRAESGGGTGLHWFYFLQEIVHDGIKYKIYFFLYHYFWSWAFLLLIFVAWRITGPRRFMALLRDKKLIEAELLIAIALAGFIPGEVFAHRGGAYFYFSDVQRWLAMSLILALLPQLARTVTDSWSYSKMRIGNALTVSIAAVLGGALVLYVGTGFATNAKQRVEALSGNGNVRGWPALSTEPMVSSVALENVKTLIRLAEMDVDAKEESCIYLPKTNKHFWAMIERAGAVSFVVPAITGIKMVAGLPAERLSGWGYHRYAFPEKTSAELESQQLLVRAEEEGCKQVYILSPLGKLAGL